MLRFKNSVIIYVKINKIILKNNFYRIKRKKYFNVYIDIKNEQCYIRC